MRVYIDDEDAIDLMIDIMNINDEPETIKELRDYVNQNGASDLFVKLIKLYNIHEKIKFIRQKRNSDK